MLFNFSVKVFSICHSNTNLFGPPFTIKILTRNQNSRTLNVPAFHLLGLHIGPFMNSLAVLSSLRTSGVWNQDDVKTNNPYHTPAKEYFLNFLNERARPPEDISSSTYLTSFIHDIVETQSTIEAIEVSPGEIVKSMNIASILDNVYDAMRCSSQMKIGLDTANEKHR